MKVRAKDRLPKVKRGGLRRGDRVWCYHPYGGGDWLDAKPAIVVDIRRHAALVRFDGTQDTTHIQYHRLAKREEKKMSLKQKLEERGAIRTQPLAVVPPEPEPEPEPAPAPASWAGSYVQLSRLQLRETAIVITRYVGSGAKKPGAPTLSAFVCVLQEGEMRLIAAARRYPDGWLEAQKNTVLRRVDKQQVMCVYRTLEVAAELGADSALLKLVEDTYLQMGEQESQRLKTLEQERKKHEAKQQEVAEAIKKLDPKQLDAILAALKGSQ